jgi:hypothetical protein
VIKVYYWCDGCWCYYNEIGQMAHKSDDYTTLEVPDEFCDLEIDAQVHDLVAKETIAFAELFHNL